MLPNCGCLSIPYRILTDSNKTWFTKYIITLSIPYRILTELTEMINEIVNYYNLSIPYRILTKYITKTYKISNDNFQFPIGFSHITEDLQLNVGAITFNSLSDSHADDSEEIL